MQQESTKELNLKVIVCMLAYNHGKFISQAIESVFNQKTNFEYKLLICNDSSTDNTKEIIEKYCSIHGDKIIAVHNKNNIGITRNAKQLYSLAINTGAEYIATLEGDDYWVDSNKLQLQVEHMDNNSNLVLTCGNFKEYDNEVGLFNTSNIQVENNEAWETLEKNSLLTTWKTKYLTYMIRASILKDTNFLKYQYLVDYHLVYDLIKKGPIEFYSGIFGIYRRHLNGNFGKEKVWKKNKIELKIYKSLLKVHPSDDFLWEKYRKISKKSGFILRLSYKLEFKLKHIILGI